MLNKLLNNKDARTVISWYLFVLVAWAFLYATNKGTLELMPGGIIMIWIGVPVFLVLFWTKI